MTKAETLLWHEIRNRKLLECKFRRQFSFGSRVVDFYSPEIKLAIEIDGPNHKVYEEIENDKFRQEEIEILDVVFLRFDNQEIYETMQNVLSEIRNNIIALRLKQDPLCAPIGAHLPLAKGEK